MSSKEKIHKFHHSKYQQELWDKQHSNRGGDGGLENILRFDPNQSGEQFGEIIARKSCILEIGSGNGRDARYWASQDHVVYCVDFSRVALDQLMKIAHGQEIAHRIVPVLHDISGGDLPLNDQKFDGFYAISSLHIEDSKILKLVKKVDTHLKPESKILIMGKSEDDTKIRRSVLIDGGLAIDMEEGGHLRRVWTPDFMEEMCAAVGWGIEYIEQTSEKINNQRTSFIKLIAQKNG